MEISMKLPLSVVLCAILIQLSEALECYSCRSATGWCVEGAKSMKDDSVFDLASCADADEYCMKWVRANGEVARGCQKGSGMPFADGTSCEHACDKAKADGNLKEKKAITVNGDEVWCCDSDNCNSATGLAPMTTIIVSLVVAVWKIVL